MANDHPLTREQVRAMTWEERDATTVEQRRQYMRDVLGIPVGDNEHVSSGIFALGLPDEITQSDQEHARTFESTWDLAIRVAAEAGAKRYVTQKLSERAPNQCTATMLYNGRDMHICGSERGHEGPHSNSDGSLIWTFRQ